MPTNSDYDGFFSNIDGVPLFTYGMITTTIIVLSYMTFMESDTPEDIIEATGPESNMASLVVPPPPASMTNEESLNYPEELNSEQESNIQPDEGEREEEQMIQPEENQVEEGEEEQMIQPEENSIPVVKGGKKRRTKRRKPKLNI